MDICIEVCLWVPILTGLCVATLIHILNTFMGFSRSGRDSNCFSTENLREVGTAVHKDYMESL